MSKTSTKAKTVTRSADDIAQPTVERLKELRFPRKSLDMSDIPEVKSSMRRVVRDTSGRLPTTKAGTILRMIRNRLDELQMSRYELGKQARIDYPTLSTSAVYDFLAGRRDIHTLYTEALMNAVGLHVGLSPKKRRSDVSKPTQLSPKKSKTPSEVS